MKYGIILAAGKGSRMNSSLNKVMHKIVDKPIIGHLVDKLKQLELDEIDVVVGFQQQQIRDYLKEKVNYCVQENPLGTAHAIQQVTSLSNKKGKTIILVGDAPLIQIKTIESMFDMAQSFDLVLLTTQLSDPQYYGRVIRNNLGEITEIVEFREIDANQKTTNEINTGIMVVDNELLFKYIHQIENNNNSKEYYLTDLVKIMAHNNHSIKSILLPDFHEAMGINDRAQLASANMWLQQKINEQWMNEGVSMINPHQTYISIDAKIEPDVTIYPNVFIKGQSTIGSQTTIYPNSWIENSHIGSNTTIDSSKIVDSTVGNHVTVGPFAHLRMNTEVKDEVRIGNFNELKNTTLGYKTRCAHLSYLGDTTVGEDVNIGCGVVTVNYDGLHKFKTMIKDGAFVGSNVNLIAPLTVGKNAVVAAGSTISNDVLDGDMVIVRSEPIIKTGKGFTYIKKEGK